VAYHFASGARTTGYYERVFGRFITKYQAVNSTYEESVPQQMPSMTGLIRTDQGYGGKGSRGKSPFTLMTNYLSVP
jgi:hypothetical protein